MLKLLLALWLECDAGFIASVRLRGGENDSPSSVEVVDQASRLLTENTSSMCGRGPWKTSGEGLPVARP